MPWVQKQTLETVFFPRFSTFVVVVVAVVVVVGGGGGGVAVVVTAFLWQGSYGSAKMAAKQVFPEICVETLDWDLNNANKLMALM